MLEIFRIKDVTVCNDCGLNNHGVPERKSMFLMESDGCCHNLKGWGESVKHRNIMNEFERFVRGKRGWKTLLGAQSIV